MGNNTAVDGLNEKVAREQHLSRRGRLSQFMIFFNGLILTITAFATLMIFMDQIQTSKIHTLNEKILGIVQNFFQDSSDKIAAVPLYDPKVLVEGNVIYEQLDSRFDSLFILSKNEAGRWKIQKILKDLDSKAANTLLKRFNQDDHSVDFNVSYIPFDHEKPQIAAVMRYKNDSYVIGTLGQSKISEMWNDNPLLHKLNIFDNTNGLQLLKILRPVDPNKKTYGDASQIIETVEAGATNLTVTTEISPDSYASFIGKLPYLLLLFGGTLTIIGTLYVRNNQRQAYQLEIMNSALEDKNDTLKNNIEESKRLHQQLKKKEREYSTVLNSVQDVLFEIDVKGNVTFINAAWTRVTGFNTEEIIERNIFDFIKNSDNSKIQKLYADFLSNGKHPEIETQIICSDQSYKPVNLVFSVQYDNENGQKSVIGTIKDIQDKQRAEHALTEVEKKYRTIVENASGGIYQITPDGTIMSGNPALAHILGYENMEELLDSGLNMNDMFVSKQERKAYHIALNKDGFIRNHEAELETINGDVVWINENARCVRDLDGSILYYEGSIEDITQRKHAETALIQEKLNSDLASRAKSEFLANMSHELRTPLNSIIGFSEIIKGEALGSIENKLYVDYAKDIYDSGGRLLNIINEILGISRIEAGDRQLNESVVDIKAVVKTCLNLLAGKLENSQLEVNNIIDENTPSVIAEELAFKQIFMNLLSNAIKFTPADGKITISSEYYPEGDLRISITDTGVGIDEADIPKAMSPFGQLDNALSRSNSGTGLGLTLVSSLLRLHRGKLEMISQKNIGTTVTVVIPAKRVTVPKKVDDDHKGENIASFRDYKNNN